jgi:hypothetical protein
MKFYLEIVQQLTLKRPRTVHLLKDENRPVGGSLCKASLNLEKWIMVEELPEDIHLCRSCERSASKNPG